MTVYSFARKQFLQSLLTSIPQIISVRGIFRKIIKSLVLVGCLSGCTYQIWSFMNVYWTYPTVVDVIIINPNVIDIPAFTICEYNGLKSSGFCRRNPDLCTPFKSYNEFCNTHYKYCSKDITNPVAGMKLPAIPPWELPENMSYVRNYYRSLGYKDFEFISDVSYNGEKLSSTELLVFNNEGVPTNCFAYNVAWNKPRDLQRKVTLRNEYNILVKMNGDDYFYNSTPLAVQIVVHSPFKELNPFADGFSLKPCTTYRMYLEKTESYLLPAPYLTNCTDYEKLWRSRGGNGPLNKKMCADECAFNKSIELYGCFDPKTITHPNNQPFCYFKDVPEETFDDCNNECNPACFGENFKVIIEEFETSLTSDQESRKTCITGITISFIRTQVEKYVHSKRYEVIEAFGYIGGFLGMWLGLSLIAVFDFIETCFVILVHAAKRMRKRRNKGRIHDVKIKKIFYI